MNEGGEGAWVQADNGKWWYRYSDGTYPSTCTSASNWTKDFCSRMKDGYSVNSACVLLKLNYPYSEEAWAENYVICGSLSTKLN